MVELQWSLSPGLYSPTSALNQLDPSPNPILTPTSSPSPTSPSASPNPNQAALVTWRLIEGADSTTGSWRARTSRTLSMRSPDEARSWSDVAADLPQNVRAVIRDDGQVLGRYGSRGRGVAESRSRGVAPTCVSKTASMHNVWSMAEEHGAGRRGAGRRAGSRSGGWVRHGTGDRGP